MSFHLALVTGATSGIGEALARLLASKKIPLLIVGRNRKKLQALKKEFSKTTKVIPMAADLSKRQGKDKVLLAIREMKPDLVVNCAGLGFWGKLIKNPIEDQLKIIETNVTALVELSIETAKMLQEHRKEGVILNISSIGGELDCPKLAVYGASKAFVISFSKSMDIEMKPQGIRVLVSCPGVVESPFAMIAAKRSVKYKGMIRGVLMKPETLAKKLWKQITKKKGYDIPDKRYYPVLWFSKISPKKLNQAIYYKIFSYYEN